MLLRHFQVFFNIAGEKIICSFFPARHTRNFPARKIKLVVSQQAAKWAASKQKNDNFLHRMSKWAWQKASNPPFSGGSGGGGNPRYFSTFPHQPMLQMLENIINSETNPSAVTNFPASSSEHVLFCQPARFLWGTDKVRNRFVGCPCK